MARYSLWQVTRYKLKQLFPGNARKRLTARYTRVRGRKPDLDHPSDLSEYILSNMLHRRNDRYADLADKVKVRDYVASKGLGHLLPALYDVREKASEIDFEALPERFAIKANHGCGYNIICHDKRTFDVEKAVKKLTTWSKIRYKPIETHYSLIKPLIFAEEFIDDGSGACPTDYKFMCCKGEPVVVLVCTERGSESGTKKYIFDLGWNHRPEYLTEPCDDAETVAKPANFERMKEYARVLSRDFEYVRVDFYDTGDRVWFGEMTFSPAAGSFIHFSDRLLRDVYAKVKE